MKKKKLIEVISDRCKTAYPILMAHGLGFRDDKRFCYWGRITKKFVENGGQVFYGKTEAYATIETNGAILAERVNEILAETGAEKVNIIAHSKGGVDARYAISTLGIAGKVASLSTISTPHNGSKSLDFYCRFPRWLRKFIAFFPNIWYRIIGDKKPHFNAVAEQITTSACKQFNLNNPDIAGVYYQSFATVMRHFYSDFWMIIPYLTIKIFEGQSDGLVTPKAAEWTNFRGILSGPNSRGISHGDSVDFRRRRFTKKTAKGKYSDITDFYIELVEGLKNQGL